MILKENWQQYRNKTMKKTLLILTASQLTIHIYNISNLSNNIGLYVSAVERRFSNKHKNNENGRIGALNAFSSSKHQHSHHHQSRMRRTKKNRKDFF
jgi:hypothetical protein